MSDNIQFAPPQELRIVTSTESNKHSRMKRFIAAGAVVVTLAVGLGVAADHIGGAINLPGIPKVEKKTTEGLSTVIARELQKTKEFRGSKTTYGITAELTRSEKFLFVKDQERDVISTTGTARGVIDLSAVNESSVEVSPDNRTVVIKLPHAQVTDVSASHKKEEGMVIIEDKNLPCKVDKCDYISDTELLELADRKLEEAVAADKDLLPAAEQEAREFFGGFINMIGVPLLQNQDPLKAPNHIDVQVIFGDAMPTASTLPLNSAR